MRIQIPGTERMVGGTARVRIPEEASTVGGTVRVQIPGSGRMVGEMARGPFHWTGVPSIHIISYFYV